MPNEIWKKYEAFKSEIGDCCRLYLCLLHFHIPYLMYKLHSMLLLLLLLHRFLSGTQGQNRQISRMKTSWLLKACVVPTWRLKCEARTPFTWSESLKWKNLCRREFSSWKWTSPNNICVVAGELNFGVLINKSFTSQLYTRARKSPGSMKHSLQSAKLLWDCTF